MAEQQTGKAQGSDRGGDEPLKGRAADRDGHQVKGRLHSRPKVRRAGDLLGGGEGALWPERERRAPGATHLKWSCSATLKSKASPRSPKPIPMNARRPGDSTRSGPLGRPHPPQGDTHPGPCLPFPSSTRITKYRLESVTLSTAVPGNWSTGACAKSSPESTSRGESAASPPDVSLLLL